MKAVSSIGWTGLFTSLWLVGCAQDVGPEVSSSPAYVVANYRITDAESYAEYGPLARPTLVAHGAEILAVDSESEVIEGVADHHTVVVRFPSKDAARAWYNSPEYQEIIHLRTDNSEGFGVLINGIPVSE
jgi:uncharacterized protein (DUF1330 family)